MSPSTTLALTPGAGGLPRLQLACADGARAEIYAHGAHLTSWVSAGGRERLYLSGGARFTPGVAIRGGVPVIFPQFAGEGPLPKHGFARALPWEPVTVTQEGERVGAVFRLMDNAATHQVWAREFLAELRLRIGGGEVEIGLSVENQDAVAFAFTAALHTYLRVDDIAAVRLHGLQGLRYRDTARGGVEGREAQAALAIDGEVDRIYFGAPPRLELAEPAGRLAIESSGFPDAVVWNPGAARAASFGDLDTDGWRRFLCVESAVIGTPVQLAPGQRWSGTQKLAVL
jgi:glucose-6-phosphate 1-epimerase